jgi:DNA-binding LytR/AlgR family response regulator
MKVLILEDERKAANELRTLIAQLKPHWEVTAIIPSVAEAIAWFAQHPMPGLVLSDIQLADAVCFSIFEQVQVNCPIIFCTAYDEYAIKSFETSSVDYLLKPIDKTRLEKALAKLDKMKALFTGSTPVAASSGTYADLGRLIQELLPAADKTLLIHQKEKIIPVPYADIAYFHYGHGVVAIKLLSGASYHISQGIDEIEAGTDARLFYRANRQFLVNRHAIRAVEKFFARKLVVKLKTEVPETLIVSKAKASEFLRWLQG